MAEGPDLIRLAVFGQPVAHSLSPRIHAQFARNIVLGHGFSYNPGEPTSGSTAPLWTLVLAAGHLVEEAGVQHRPDLLELHRPVGRRHHVQQVHLGAVVLRHAERVGQRIGLGFDPDRAAPQAQLVGDAGLPGSCSRENQYRAIDLLRSFTLRRILTNRFEMAPYSFGKGKPLP